MGKKKWEFSKPWGCWCVLLSGRAVKAVQAKTAGGCFSCWWGPSGTEYLQTFGFPITVCTCRSWSCSSAGAGTPRWAQPPLPAALVPNFWLLGKTHLHLRAVLLLLRLKSIVYIATHPKTGTRSKLNINPASGAASERLCFYSRWRTEELLIHFLHFEVCLVNK